MKKTFKKAERLHKKKQIQELFSKGSYFYLFPFKVYQLPLSEATVSQVLVSVPKRNFKKAVDRNKIKRKIKEAYRISKNDLLATNHLLIGFIYTARESLNFQQIQKGVIAAIEKIASTNHSSDG